MREQIWEERIYRCRSTSRMISRSRSVSRMAAAVEARLKRGRREDAMRQPYRTGNGHRRRQVLRFRAKLQVEDIAHALQRHARRGPSNPLPERLPYYYQ